MSEVAIVSRNRLEPFSFRWPDGTEQFETGWECEVTIDGATHRLRHGVGEREVYGRLRVHTVTWLDREVQVEGVEADDYPTSQALISRLRRPGRATVRTFDEIPAGYDGFEIVQHRAEIDAPYSPTCLAVKVGEDDLALWALHAWLRSQLPRRSGGVPAQRTAVPDVVAPAVRPSLGPPSLTDSHAVVAALLAHADRLAAQLTANGVQFTPNPEANQMVIDDPFAFLVAVVADMGIKAERAWALPYELRERLGYFDPVSIAENGAAVAAAVQQAPKLHRFVNLIPGWIVEAARIVLDDYDGDAGRLWRDEPTVTELRCRLEVFPGIAQKKGAMAVEILERDLKVPLRDLTGSDVAFDVHLRRVFLRGGLAEHDDVGEMVAAAQALYPERPGALDFPAWDIGRRWCHPRDPDCATCPLNVACPRLIDRAAHVRGA
jgi:uncharacterized HhH-GPD family protein